MCIRDRYQGDFTNKTCNNLNDFTTYRFENIDIPNDSIINSYTISVGNDNFKLIDHEIDFRNETGSYIRQEKNKGGGTIHNNSKNWDLKDGGLYIYPDANGVTGETSANNN